MEHYNGGIAKSDEQIAQLLRMRPPCWEYLLYAGALSAGMERLETKYMDYSLGYAPRSGVMIARGEFLYFINSQLNELSVMMANLDTLINGKVLEEALGPPGVSGEPDKIMHAASRIIRIYEDMLLWAERLRGMAMPSEYYEVTKILARFSEQPINEVRDFIRRFGNQIDKLPDRIALGEPVMIEETLKFLIPDEIKRSFDVKLDALKKK